jgi:hypothetical protein
LEVALGWLPYYQAQAVLHSLGMTALSSRSARVLGRRVGGLAAYAVPRVTLAMALMGGEVVALA